MTAELVVRVGDAEHRCAPGESFTFGRSATCTVCLDPDDTTISRRFGQVDHERGAWWLINASDSRHLAVVNEVGFRNLLTPGKRMAVEGRIRVIVEGTRSHELVLEAPSVAPDLAPSACDEVSTSIGAGVVINDLDRAALVALFGGYLEEGARYHPYPKKYVAAAKRLGWPRTTLVKRIEYLRKRLAEAGVPNMNDLTGLAEHVLAARIITREDLRLLG